MALVFLALKFALIGLIYIFLYQIVKAIWLDMSYASLHHMLDSSNDGGQGDRQGEMGSGPGLYVVGDHGEFPPGAFFAIEPLADAAVTLGRGSGNTISIPDPYISTVHARITKRGEGYWLEDLGSRNGTFLNGKKVSRAVRLRPGDTIAVGNTTFRFRG